MQTFEIPQEVKDQWKYAINEARKDRDRYFKWIKDEIEVAITLINKFDKIYVLGGLGARMIKAAPTFHNQFMEAYHDRREESDIRLEDDEIEVLLEYAMSIATASDNTNAGIIPSQEDIDAIREQLIKVKVNVNFWEQTAETPAGGTDADHWLRTQIMQDSMNVRGDGYQLHIHEVYKEVFTPFDGFLDQYYGFNSGDIFSALLNLDDLVFSKVGTLMGSVKSHDRFKKWSEAKGDAAMVEAMRTRGMHFFELYAEENPDISLPEEGIGILHYTLDDIKAYPKIFWVIPQSDKEKLIFEHLSTSFGANQVFFEPPKFKAFPLNDTLIKHKPIIKFDDKYYHFSLSLAYRNIFKITENLIKSADAVYYENSFKNNSAYNSRDNYIERKTKQLFEKLLPSVTFYHSLKYEIVEDGMNKTTELDILGVTDEAIYIIEVKAGELNIKHRRGALKGLKDRLKETINEGSYQCHRALSYIEGNPSPTFEYIDGGTRKTLTVDKSKVKKYYKISVTFEHFAAISTNLRYLIKAGILDSVFNETWIVSLYDLMVFVDLIETEDDFKEYLDHRLSVYTRDDIVFSDEIDVLGFYFDGQFPLAEGKKDQILEIQGYSEDIDDYYTKKIVGLPGVIKPKKNV